jgi:hypothetical protein
VTGLAARHLLLAGTAHTSLSSQRLAEMPETLWLKAQQESLACHPKDFRPVYSFQANRRLLGRTEPERTFTTRLSPISFVDRSTTRPGPMKWPSGDTCKPLGISYSLVYVWEFILDRSATTTPRPLPLIRKMMNDETVVVTRGAYSRQSG